MQGESTCDRYQSYWHCVKWNVRAAGVMAAGILGLIAVACGGPSALDHQGLTADATTPDSPTVGTTLQGSPGRLARGQWLHTQASEAFSIDGLPLGVAGEISVPALSQSWANEDATCVEVSFGAPEFSSASLRSAWIANGLSTNPLMGLPKGFCEANTPGGGALAFDPKGGAANVLTQGLGVIDVASMSRDSSTLARQLTSGRTDNEMFDQAVQGRSYPNLGFERALLVLQTPLLGATADFRLALLHALPHIPGVVVLGRQRNSSGLTGIGFAAGKGRHEATVILNPRTGQLEETRYVPAGSLYFSVGAESFWNPYAPHVPGSSPSSLSLNVLRSDPIGDQTVVNSVPAFGYPS